MVHYNTKRPHQGIGMAVPAQRFAAAPRMQAAAVVALPDATHAEPPAPQRPRRRVSPEGRVNVEGHRYQVGAWLAGETVEVVRIDGLLEVSHRGVLVASHVARRPDRGTAPAQVRPPRPPAPGSRPVLRKVGSNGGICFAGSFYRVGDAYRGQQVEVRLVGDSVEIAQHGRLLRSWPARHDRFREHGAFSNPAGRPRRSNASPFSDPEPVTQLPKPMCNAGGET